MREMCRKGSRHKVTLEKLDIKETEKIWVPIEIYRRAADIGIIEQRFGSEKTVDCWIVR